MVPVTLIFFNSSFWKWIMNAKEITFFISESALAYMSSLKTPPIELESKCKV